MENGHFIPQVSPHSHTDSLDVTVQRYAHRLYYSTEYKLESRTLSGSV